MTGSIICDDDRRVLLQLARKSVEAASLGKQLPALDLNSFSETLNENGASFVTLTNKGSLRGCIGTLEAYQPLVRDIIERAAAAAVDDFRFNPVRPEEVSSIDIEISVLSKPEILRYSGPDDLLERLKPGIDGVILKDGRMRATFLPQVWEQLPDKQEFLSHLCSKMGATSELWKLKNLEVFTYQVIEFHE